MTTNTGAGVVQAGYEDAGLCAVGQTVSTALMTRGIARLNDIINLWATQGLKLWLVQDVPVPLVAAQAKYRLGPTGDVVMTRPLQINQAYYRYTSGQRQPLTVLSKDQYTRLANTANQGALSSYYVDKQATYFDVSFWNVPDVAAAAGGSAYLVARVAAPNLVVSTDNVNFPPEWTIALRWALADEVAVGQPQAIIDRCATRAGAYRSALEDFDVEDTPITFQLDPNSQYNTQSFT